MVWYTRRGIASTGGVFRASMAPRRRVYAVVTVAEPCIPDPPGDYSISDATAIAIAAAAGADDDHVVIYDGTPPDDVFAALGQYTTNNIRVTITLNDPPYLTPTMACNRAVAALSNTPSAPSGVAVAGGTPTFYRVFDSLNNPLKQGTVTLTAGDGDMRFSNLTWSASDTIYFEYWSEVLPDLEELSALVLGNPVYAFRKLLTMTFDEVDPATTAVRVSGTSQGGMLLELLTQVGYGIPTGSVPPDGSPEGLYRVNDGTDGGLYVSNGVKTYLITLD